MKKIINISALLLLTFFFVACDHEENEVLPDFLDGTEYGVLLKVNVTGSSAINISDVATANVTFEVSFDGDQRPVQSVTVNKIFVGGGTTSGTIAQTSLSSFPSSVSLSVQDLVSNVPNLSTDALQAGDKFQIKFAITYADGKVVTRFGTLLNPNFDVTFN